MQLMTLQADKSGSNMTLTSDEIASDNIENDIMGIIKLQVISGK